MLLFLVSLICYGAILFAGIPAAVNRANMIHIENGRRPNAGVSFMPELIIMVALWCGVSNGMKFFWGLQITLVVVISISVMMTLWQLHLARKSNREYSLFLDEHKQEKDMSQ